MMGRRRATCGLSFLIVWVLSVAVGGRASLPRTAVPCAYDASVQLSSATPSSVDPTTAADRDIGPLGRSATDLSRGPAVFVAAETGEGTAVDVGHAGIHQYPGVTAGKSQFFDGENLGGLSNTDGVTGVLQKNGNTRYVMRGTQDVGVDRTTGLPTDAYTVIRKPDGSVLTMFPGTSPKG